LTPHKIQDGFKPFFQKLFLAKEIQIAIQISLELIHHQYQEFN